MYRTWDELEKRYREQSRWWSPTPEPSSNNPQELEEVEAVRPEWIARWRLIGVPEENIERMIRQREWVTQQRKLEEWITLPNIRYPTPKTLVETEIKAFSLGIDVEGWITPRAVYYHDRTRRIDRWLYKREGYIPLIAFSTSAIEPTEFMANLMLMGISARREIRPQKPITVMYYTRARHSRAVACAYHLETNLLIPEKARRAREILTLYRERPLIPMKQVACPKSHHQGIRFINELTNKSDRWDDEGKK